MNPEELSSVSTPLPIHLNVTIFGQPFLGLLDSGASVTIVGNQGYNKLTGLNLPLKPCKDLTCTVEGKVKIINAIVVPDVSHALILGADFWKSMGIVPDLRRGLWTFTDNPESLQQISSITSSEHLTADQKLQLHNLISKIFIDMPDELGCTSLVQHTIRTKAEPIKQRFYPISPALQKIVNAELDDMLAKGVVRPSNSPWSSPIVLVKKKDGSYRFCVDYRKVNKVTERDAFPLPFVSHTLDKLRDAKYLTSLDIKSAYWQVPVEESSRPITAFTVPGRGLFEFCRMPFGLHNSCATWQRLIDGVLGMDLEPFVFVYLDDVVIITQTFEKHLEVVQEVFNRLKRAGLTVRREKCQFCVHEMKYLGYVVDKDGLHVDPDKVSAILQIPTPDFSTLVAPISRLMQKNVKFEWATECEEAWRKIKEHLISAPIMSCPNFELPFVIQTDASDYGLGAVLTQTSDEGEKVISYISRSLSKAERKFSTTEKECLAVVWAIEKFRPYVEATEFTVITDHFALLWLHSLKEPSGRLARWSVRLQQYDFNIVHRKGKDNIVPDTLSRGVPIIAEVDHRQDPWISRMIERIKTDPLKYPLWSYDGKLLYKRCTDKYQNLGNPGDEWKIVVPKPQRKEILRQLHDNPTSGHCGIYKTYRRVTQRYFWPKL